MKRKIALILSCLTLISCLVVGASAKSQTKHASNSEFGTLTGYQSSKKNGPCRYFYYYTKTTKTASKLYITMQLVNASTGKPRLNTKKVSKSNTKKVTGQRGLNSLDNLTSYGAHEARGQTGLVVYTAIKNI